MTTRIDELPRRRPMTPAAGDYKPVVPVDPADVLARVYMLILSWPTAEEKLAQLEEAHHD